MSSHADTLTQIRSGDCCRMLECPREAKLLAENQQLRDALEIAQPFIDERTQRGLAAAQIVQAALAAVRVEEA